MNGNLYPLAKSYFGVEHVAVLDNVVLSTALSLPTLSEAPLALDVTLEADAFTGGWRVRSHFGILGYLDAQEAADYPALDRVRASGLQLSTRATVEILPAEGCVDVAVSLGLAPWMIPNNDQPAGSVLLCGGLGLLVDTASGQLNDAQLDQMGTQQLFVTLHDVEGDIVAATPGTVLGGVAAAGQQPHLNAILERAAGQGTTVAARAFSADRRLAVDVPSPDATEFFAASVPALGIPPSRPAIPPATVEPTTFMAWETGLDAADFSADLPHGMRHIASPTATQPEPVTAQPEPVATQPEPAAQPESAAPGQAHAELADLVSHMPGQQTLAWRDLPTATAPGRFSSESARVRARRSQRDAAHRRGGNHRK
ncbi:hypothetical protein ACS0VK_08560 [Corynebacterium striatum]|uniref:hypothetical protein n=1 Tax=Corynebacterium striatum TaxID=43770 RepID=UPI003EC6F083